MPAAARAYGEASASRLRVHSALAFAMATAFTAACRALLAALLAMVVDDGSHAANPSPAETRRNANKKVNVSPAFNLFGF